MFQRIGLTVLMVSLAAVATNISETSLSQVSPAMLMFNETFPWVSLQHVSGSTQGFYGVVCFIVLAAVVLTTIRIHGFGLRLLRKPGDYISRGMIMGVGLMLIIDGVIYGMVAAPFSHNGTELAFWFEQFPQSVPVWFMLAPVGIVTVNFVFEIIRAMHEWEKRGRHYTNREVEILEKLDVVLQCFHVLGSKLDDRESTNMTASLIGDVARISVSTRRIAERVDALTAIHQKSMDGLFTNFRWMKEKLYKQLTRLGRVDEETRRIDSLIQSLAEQPTARSKGASEEVGGPIAFLKRESNAS